LIEIDGSIGEGGGQVLRTSIALSTLLGEPVHIFNIRANRPKPGLKTQHATGIRAASRICNAKISGVELNSTEIEYIPGNIKGGKYTIEIGTAGSISLVLQELMVILAFAPEKTTLINTGGTDVNWSPPINYLQKVITPILKVMNYNFKIDLIKRGHYPKGGGKVISNFEPVHYLKPLIINNYNEIKRIEGISHCVRLPKYVAIRQINSANKILRINNFPQAKIKIESYRPDLDPHLGSGSGIVLWCIPDNDIPIGSDAYGEKGKKAEIVGEEAAKDLVIEMNSGALVDLHAGDTILPYMALAKGESRIKVRKISNHIQTNINLIEKLLHIKFKTNKVKENLFEIKVKGIGFENKNFS